MAADNIQAAAKAFKDATFYHKVRIGYSTESAKLVLTKLCILASDGQTRQAATDSNTGPVTVLELAAGTGKFTEVLVKALKDTNVRLVSSEPLESMGKVFEENLPNVEFIRCRSEKIPLPDSSVHAVVSVDATHYISNPDSYAEMARILVPGGGIAFVYKGVDSKEAPWILEVNNMIRSDYGSKGIHMKFDENGTDIAWQSELVKSGKFGEIKQAWLRFSYPTTETATLQRIMFSGAFQLLEETERKKRRERIQELLKQNYSGAGKTLTELLTLTTFFWAMKK